jgi:Ca-activated chloride channel family protein
LNLVQKDEELFGRSANVKAFIVISDGQAWSGEVANALKAATRRQASVYAVGVGTDRGGMIPMPAWGIDPNNPPPNTPAVLDRKSLREIARAGGGEYFELDRQPDREIATKIAASVKSRSRTGQTVESHEDLYWQFLFAAGVFLCAGTLLLRDPIELSWHAAAAAMTLLLLVKALR